MKAGSVLQSTQVGGLSAVAGLQGTCKLGTWAWPVQGTQGVEWGVGSSYKEVW